MEEITITVTRGTSPVLITGDHIVVEATLAALERVLRGRERARVAELKMFRPASDGGV